MFIMLTIITLHIAMIGSLVDRSLHHRHLVLAKEAVQFVFLFFIDITLLMPVVFEVDKLRIDEDKLVLKTLVFTHTIAISDILEFKSPPFLRVGLLRTRRCFYLINKRQFDQYDDLARAITSRLTLPAPQTGR
ncbi:MAG: hypothetical protein ACRD3W_05060 [Terriglobales bacterium]